MAQEKTVTAQLTGVGTDAIELSSIAVQFQRETGPDGRPSSMVHGGVLELTAAITEKTAIFEAMVNGTNKALASGKIEVFSALKEGVCRKIEFKNAYVISYQESFEMTSGVMNCSFSIAAEEITVGNGTLKQRWPKAT